MKSWNNYEFSPHEKGTPYITALRQPGRDGVPFSEHINAATARHPGRWVLVNAGIGNPKPSGALRPGVALHRKYFEVAQSVNNIGYTRNYVRIYAHDGSNIDPLELKRQADSLPKPTFDVPLDDWVKRLHLPQVDMTDGGFEWTFEELQSATNLAMFSLHSGKPLRNLIKTETLRKNRTT